MSNSAAVINISDMNLKLDAMKKLDTYASEIHKRQTRILEDCFEIGKQLLAARKLIRGTWEKGYADGHWLKWLKEEVKISHEWADSFMRVYEKYKSVQVNLNTTFTVLAALSEPGADPEGVKEIETHIKKGEKVTVKQARAAVKPQVETKKKPSLKPRGGPWTDIWVKETREYLEERIKAHAEPAERLWIKKWLQNFIDHI